jgi:hypothetical protein
VCDALKQPVDARASLGGRFRNLRAKFCCESMQFILRRLATREVALGQSNLENSFLANHTTQLLHPSLQLWHAAQ